MMNDMARPPQAFALRHATSDVDEYLRSGAGVYAKQIAVITELERAHSVRRAEIVADFAKKMAEIAAEGSEALRVFDREHQVTLGQERQKLVAIGRLRDA